MGKQTYQRVVDLLNEHIPAKISRNEFCRVTGINRNSVDRYRAGLGRPNDETLERLAQYFGVTANWLRGEEGMCKTELLKFLDKYFEFIEALEKGEMRDLGIHFTYGWFLLVKPHLTILYDSSDDEGKAELEPYMCKCSKIFHENAEWSTRTGGLLGHTYSPPED